MFDRVNINSQSMKFQRVLWILTLAIFLTACVQTGSFPFGQPGSSVPGEPDDCFRPYTANSLWNVPVDWSIARLHPHSQEMMGAFFKDDSWIGAETSRYAVNIYFINNKTLKVPVKLWTGRSFRNVIDDKNLQLGERGDTVWVPLPPGAQPAPGTDGELVVINKETGDEWGLLNAEADYFQNRWSAGGVYLYHIQNSGIPPAGFAQRGAGVGAFAGIVRPCEVERGYIGHAVTIAYSSPCRPDICQANGWPEVVPPFTKTDGEGTEQYDLPEGTRLVIRPEITKDQMTQACSGVKGCFLWALNMQEYGGFLVDNSNHPKTYAEGDATANWDQRVWSNGMLKNIPTSWYAVIDWNYPSTRLP